MSNKTSRNSKDYANKITHSLRLVNSKAFSQFHIDEKDGLSHYDKKYEKEFNSFGFRSNEFINAHKDKHILFMGCSETQGSNEDLLSCWAYILHQKINETEKTSGYFNIASVGSGIIPQIIKAHEYIKRFGKPDHIFFLCPEPYRTIQYSHNADSVIYSNITPSVGVENNVSDIANTFAYNFIILRMFELFCKNLNIELTWSTWANFEERIFEEYGFLNYFSLKMNDLSLEDLYNKYSDSTKSFEHNFIKGDKHKGIVFHRYWANMFYRDFKSEKNNK